MNTSDPGVFNASSSSSSFSLTAGSPPPATPTMQGPALPGLTTTLSLSLSTASASPSEAHNPEVTIMVVLGLAALLAGVAAFLAVRRSSERGGGGRDSEGGGGGGDGGGGFFFCGSRGGLGDSGRGDGAVTTGEPQLKVWKRLGSYRRSYNRSFRRPPPPQHRRPPPEAQSPVVVGGPGGGGGGGGGPPPARQSPTGQTPLRPESCRAEPHAATPCLFDYVTEI